MPIRVATPAELGQPTGAELERIRARYKLWNRRRHVANGAFGVVVVLAILANAFAAGALRVLVPLAVFVGLLAGINSMLWRRCPRCHTSLMDSRWHVRLHKECPECELDLAALTRPAS